MCWNDVNTWRQSYLSNKWAIATVFGWVVLLGAVAINTYIVLDQKWSAYEPLDYNNPRRVVTEQAVQGTYIDVYVQWCNSDPDALITSTSAFSGPGGVLVPRVGPIVLNLLPGCHEETVRITLPSTVTPGQWFFGGNDTAVSTDGHRYSVTWYTDSFTVVPNDS